MRCMLLRLLARLRMGALSVSVGSVSYGVTIQWPRGRLMWLEKVSAADCLPHPGMPPAVLHASETAC